MVNELAGKVAIVTGGASGIGAGIVEKFLAEGARVVIADVERDRGEDLAAKLGADAVFRLADVSDPEQISALVAGAVETFGGLDVMVNNAGVSSRMHRSFLDDDLADFHRVMSVNVLGVMAGTRDAARQMATSGGGSIINMSSVAWMRGAPALPAYAAAKAAIVGFTNSLARLVGPDRIRVNAIAPGMVITERQRRLWFPDEQQIVEVRARQAIPDAVTPDDIARLALFLASDESQRITRQCFQVDGGLG